MVVQDLAQYAGKLTKPEEISWLKDTVNAALFSGTIADRQEVMDLITRLFSAYPENIQKVPGMYEQFNIAWTLLAFKTFVAMPAEDQKELMKSRILVAVANGWNPAELVESYYNFFDDDDFIHNLFRGYADDLQANEEQLGNAPVDLGGKKVTPELRYWLTDYAQFPSRVAKRGAVERLNYINQSANVRQLNKEQRERLLAIIKLYDELLSGSRPIRENGNDSSASSVVQNQAKAANQISSSRPVVSSSPVQTPVKNQVSAQTGQNQIKPQTKPLTRPMVQDFQPKQGKPAAPNLPQNNTKPDMQQRQNINLANQPDIDRKLEDLKKRVNND